MLSSFFHVKAVAPLSHSHLILLFLIPCVCVCECNLSRFLRGPTASIHSNRERVLKHARTHAHTHAHARNARTHTQTQAQWAGWHVWRWRCRRHRCASSERPPGRGAFLQDDLFAMEHREVFRLLLNGLNPQHKHVAPRCGFQGMKGRHALSSMALGDLSFRVSSSLTPSRVIPMDPSHKSCLIVLCKLA